MCIYNASADWGVCCPRRRRRRRRRRWLVSRVTCPWLPRLAILSSGVCRSFSELPAGPAVRGVQ